MATRMETMESTRAKNTGPEAPPWPGLKAFEGSIREGGSCPPPAAVLPAEPSENLRISPEPRSCLGLPSHG